MQEVNRWLETTTTKNEGDFLNEWEKPKSYCLIETSQSSYFTIPVCASGNLAGKTYAPRGYYPKVDNCQLSEWHFSFRYSPTFYRSPCKTLSTFRHRIRPNSQTPRIVTPFTWVYCRPDRAFCCLAWFEWTLKNDVLKILHVSTIHNDDLSRGAVPSRSNEHTQRGKISS